MTSVADVTADAVRDAPHQSAPGRTRTGGAPAPDDGSPRHRRPDRAADAPSAWRRRLLVTAVFAVALFAMLRPDPATFSTNVPGNLGDGVLIAALMEWDAWAVANGQNPFDANFFFPEPMTLAYSESMIALAPVYMTFRLLGASWAAALNLTLLAQLALSLVATYLLCRRLTGRTDAAIIGALAFTFSSYTLAHAFGHLQLAMLGVFPLAYLCLLNLFERRRGWPWAIGLGLCFVVLVGSALYYAAMLAIALVVLVVGRIVVAPRHLRPAQFGNLVIAGVVALGLALPMVLPYSELRGDKFSRELSDEYALDSEDLLAPATGNYMFSLLGIEGRLAERTIENRRFPGVVPVLLAVVGAGATLGAALRARTAARRRRHDDDPDADADADADADPDPDADETGDRDGGGAGAFDPAVTRRWLLLFGVAGVVLLSLAFGPYILWMKGPYAYLYDHVPGFDGMRATSRFAVGALLVVALFAAAGWAWVARRLGTRMSRTAVAVITGVVGVLILAEQAVSVPSVPLDTSARRLAVYRAAAAAPDGPLVELPMVDPSVSGSDWAFVEAPRMLYNTIGMNRRVNGYSGYTPEGYVERARLLNTFPSPASVDELRALGVRYVMLHTGEFSGFRQYTPAQAQRIVDQLPPGATATRHGGDWLVDFSGAD